MNKELGLRIITGLVGASVIVAGLIYSYYGIWFFCLVVSVLGLWEILGIMDITEPRYRWTSTAFAVGIWVFYLLDLVEFERTSQLLSIRGDVLLAVLIFPTLSLITLFNSKETQPFQILSYTIAGFVYCFLPLVLLYQISIAPNPGAYAFALPLGILFLTWFLDSFAYFGGRLFGKHPLFPRVSPKKTWEGALSGVVFCVGLGLFLHYNTSATPYNWLIIASIISVFSQLGDLVESMFKRSRKIKDSGKLLPGHGGMLDRFDGIYLSIPFIYLYFSFI